MRRALFLILFYVAAVSEAFSDSVLYSALKDEVPVGKISRCDWNGFYSGLILGGQFGRSSDKTAAFGYNADNDEWRYNETGFNAGAEFGYNYPRDQYVMGPEVELGYLGMQGHESQPASPGGDTVGKSRNDFYTAFRARIGADFNRYLIFVTGGAIGADYTKQVVDSCNIAPCGGGTVNAKTTDFVFGYTVGAGVEHIVEKNWSIKVEGLYFNLSSQHFNGITNLGNTYSWSGKTSGYIIRGGVNYSF